MQAVRLNMTPTGVMPHVYASQYDVGRQFALVIYDEGGQYKIPSDAVVTIHGIKPDGKVFAYGSADTDAKVIVDTDESKVTVTTTEQMTAVVGITICELVISQSNLDTLESKVLGTLNFNINIEESVLPSDEDTSKSDLETYQQMLDWLRTVSAYNKAFAVRAKKTTLLASKWTGSAMPYEYDLGSDYEGYSCLIFPTNDATDDQLQSWLEAGIYGNAGATKIYARNTRPITDIPVIIVYTRLRDYEEV